MNFKILLCIGSAVFVAHLAVFMIYFRMAFHFDPPKPTPRPNFRFAEEIVPEKGGGKIVNREFTITTRLAPPGTYRGRADAPASE